MSKRIFNSLIEYLVVAGCDRDTGLKINENQHLENEYDLSGLLKIEFEPSILSVVNFDTANYPACNRFNLSYPPHTFSISKEPPIDSNDSFEIPVELLSSRRMTNRRATIKSVEAPIPSDILQNLPQFCFPTKLSINKTNQGPKIHSFVLTDIEGCKKFAVVLTYYREFYACKSELENEFALIDVNNEEDELEEKKDYIQIFVPTAIVLVSKFALFTVLKDCLSNLYESLCKEPDSFNQVIENYAFHLTRMPMPPKSLSRFRLILEYKFPFKDVKVQPQDEFDYDLFDFDLSFLFMKFHIDSILKVILAIMHESQILFISKNTGILNPIIQCFMKLIQPFKWLLPFVPLLPATQIEYIEAPNPFIMGYTANSEINTFDQSNGLIIVDIDRGQVNIPSCLNLIGFPASSVQSLMNKLAKIDLFMSHTKKITSPLKMDWQTNEDFERELNQQLNSDISDVFLEFYVDIFGDLYAFLKNQNKIFNKKKYYESIDEVDLPFFKKITSTAMFEIFINELIKNYNEKVRDLYYEKLLIVKSNENRLEILDNNSDTYSDASISINFLRGRRNSVNIFNRPVRRVLKMPSFSKSFQIYDSYIENLNRELESSNLISHRDSLLYLRGIFHFSINKLIESFRDFYSIEIKELFPGKLIANEIYPSLSLAQKELIKDQDFYKNAQEYKQISNTFKRMPFIPTMSMEMIDEDFENLSDLSFNDFCEKMDQLEIRLDSETIRRLFNSLTLEKKTEVDSTTFDLFLENYQTKDEELQKINKYLPSNKLRSIEFGLKISNDSLVPNHGIGRIVLTQKCLYFLEQGTNKRKTLAELKNIQSIEKCQYVKGVFYSRPALKISTQNETIHICDDEINLWFLLINELCNSIKLSVEHRDPSIVQYAAKNVLLLDAVICSGRNPLAFYHEELEKAAKYLTFYTLLKEDSTKKLSNEAIEILNLRINPSNKEFNTNQSVEAIIYVNIDEYPTIWCAIGNRIKIYDAIAWLEEITDITTNDKITCMLNEPNQSKVWVGTLDKCLYVIDVASRSFNKKIELHSDVIISIVLFSNASKVLSASSNGELIVWDPTRLEKIDIIKLDTVLNHNGILSNLVTSKKYIICTYNEKISILDENFTLKEKLLFELGTVKEKISCICISFNSTTSEELLWVANTKNGIILVWNIDNFELKMRIGVDDCCGYRTLIWIDQLIWAGSKDGKLSLFCIENFECEKSFEAHTDSIRSICYVESSKIVVSGSCSKDGTIAVWRTSRLDHKTIMSSIKKMLNSEKNSSNSLNSTSSSSSN